LALRSPQGPIDRTLTISFLLLGFPRRYGRGAILLEGDGHGAASPLEVGKLAFIRTEFYEALRGSRERVARFLQFILDYVVQVDDSWKRPVQVPCECGEAHEIIPCDWLSFLREREWVPRSRGGQERLNDASLARLTRHDPRLADTVTREEHADFLNLLGINVLEQPVLAAGESRGAELRRKLAQLALLAIQHPDAVTQMIRDIEAHYEADKRWQANQKLGKMVEELVQAHLKSWLDSLRIRVKAQFKGCDLGAYIDDSSDVGSIEVRKTETLLAKIEIKATRGKAVSLSNVQGEEASNDQNRFWLCVDWRPPARIFRTPWRAPTNEDSISNTSMTFAMASAPRYGKAKRYH
jgi:hypothetical protein